MTMSNDGKNLGIFCRWALPLAAVAVLALIVAASQWGTRAAQAASPPTAAPTPMLGEGTVYVAPLTAKVNISPTGDPNDPSGLGTCSFGPGTMKVYRLPPSNNPVPTPESHTYLISGFSASGYCDFGALPRLQPIYLSLDPDGGNNSGQATEKVNITSGIIDWPATGTANMTLLFTTPYKNLKMDVSITFGTQNGYDSASGTLAAGSLIERDTGNFFGAVDPALISFAPTAPPAPVGGVGGVVKVPDVSGGGAADSAASAQQPSSPNGTYAAVAGALAAAIVLATAGAWYARRRWLLR